MASPYNAGKYNLVGFNVTPTTTMFAAAVVTERISFIAASTVNNVYPKARLYENINLSKAQLVPGRFATAAGSLIITNTSALLIGCSWRQVTSEDAITGEMVGLRQFWRTVTSNDTLGIRKATIIGAFWQTADMEDEIGCAKAELIGMSWRQATSSDVIDAEIKPSVIVFTGAGSNDALSGQFHLSEEVFSSGTTEDVILGHFVLGSHTFVPVESFDLIDAHCDVLSQEILTCIITATLGPGKTMVIDAGTYDVRIDGQNAVYTHSGDWLDELNRNTQNFTINAAAGAANINATIFYTERYL